VYSCSTVFLQLTYASFHKLDMSQTDIKVAIITDKINEMIENDDDDTPVDDEGNKFTQ
jgi:hypothetical protein